MLEQLMAERRAPRTIAGWAEYLRRLLEEMVFEAGAKEDDDHPHFISLIEEMSALDELVKVEVSFEVFRHSFLHRLVKEQRTRAFLAQGITFCSMVPMRSIPFRVIAMLGMDYDKFPRRDSGVSFSYLVSGEPRPGDRNVRNNDRHLFLETLLSAREMLYISYCSRDEKDAALKPPSSLVDELIDYVGKGMADQPDNEHLRKDWVLQHPLHGFNSAYFDGRNAALRNYLPESRFRTGIEVAEGAPRIQTFDLQDVDIDKLAGFLQNPPKTFLQRQFNVSCCRSTRSLKWITFRSMHFARTCWNWIPQGCRILPVNSSAPESCPCITWAQRWPDISWTIWCIYGKPLKLSAKDASHSL
jgi:exodeoxyribonuclease V gamma subunit